MKVYSKIKELLETNLLLRDSDRRLYWKMWEDQGLVHDGKINEEDFIYNSLSTETMRRNRQKIQETYPALKGTEKVMKMRKRQEQHWSNLFGEEV